MKSIFVFVMTAATVTLFIHVKQHGSVLPRMHHVEEISTPTPDPKRSDILVAPFDGGKVGERWGKGSR